MFAVKHIPCSRSYYSDFNASARQLRRLADKSECGHLRAATKPVSKLKAASIIAESIELAYNLPYVGIDEGICVAREYRESEVSHRRRMEGDRY